MNGEMQYIIIIFFAVCFFVFIRFYFEPMRELQSEFRKAYMNGDTERAYRVRNLILDRQRASWVRKILVKMGIAQEID